MKLMSSAVTSFINHIKDQLESLRNPQDALAMIAYMKNQFPYLGIKSDVRKEATKQAINKFIKDSPHLAFEVAKALWQLPEREYQYVAIELLIKYKKKLKESDIDEIEYLIVEKSWWDSVDHLATHLAGAYFQKYPDQLQERIHFWSKSGNKWLVRSAILFQLKYKESTDTKLLATLCHEHARDKEFFVAKAIGWVLREYAKTDADWVIDFVNSTPLQNLSKREAFKHISL